MRDGTCMQVNVRNAVRRAARHLAPARKAHFRDQIRGHRSHGPSRLDHLCVQIRHIVSGVSAAAPLNPHLSRPAYLVGEDVPVRQPRLFP